MSLSEAEEALLSDRILTPDLDRGAVATALQTVERTVGVDWLNDQSVSHPLRELWVRKDFIATQELFTLGDSIRLIEQIDTAWLADALNHVKSFNRNNRVGYVFEIIVIAALLRGGHHVVPAPPNNEVYDADVKLAGNTIGRISFKNFGASDAEQRFAKRAKAFSKKVQEVARTRRWLGIRAVCDIFPAPADWAMLEQAISGTASMLPTVSKGVWRISVVPPPCPLNMLATSRASYAVQLIAPHSKNEAKNFMDNIESASLRLNAAAATYHDSTRAILIIRLSENGRLDTYIDWAKKYVNGEFNKANVNIAGVFILQMTIAQNVVEDSTSIVNNIDGAWRQGLDAPGLCLSMLVGKSSIKPSRLVAIEDGVEVPLDGYHVFSDVNVYCVSDLNPADGKTINMRQNPGFVIHGGFRLPDGEEVILSPKHKTPNRLTMFM